MDTDVDTVVEQLVRSNSAHDRIEQARGMTVVQTGDTMQRALQRMRDHARDHNLSLVAVAHLIVDGRLKWDA